MGTIRKRGDRFQAIVRVSGHDHEYETFASRKEAKDWIIKTEQAIEAKSLASPDLSLVTLIEQYEKEIAPKRQMADSHLAHDTRSIKKSFAGMTMRDLTGRGITDWVLKQTTSPGTRNWHVARLCGVLRQAETHWDVAVPWDDIKRCRDRMWELGYIGVSKERDRRITDAEMTTIKAQVTKGTRIPAADVFDFCLKSAMRIGEVTRIQWDDLNEAASTVVIRDRKHPRKKFGNHQVVPLLNGSLDIILRQPRTDERIFPMHPCVPSKVFLECCRRAGVEDAVLHDLRHEAISRLFEMGFQIQEVAMVSGHRDWKLLRRYTHLKPHSLVEKGRRLLEEKVHPQADASTGRTAVLPAGAGPREPNIA